MNLQQKTYSLPYIFLLCGLLTNCQQEIPVAQLEVNDVCIEEYEFDCITLGLEGCKLVVQCEEDKESDLKPAKKKKKSKKNAFQKHVHLFLELMQSGDIAEAAKYSTEYGLKSFLNFDIDKIEEFSIRQAKADAVLGTAMVKINGLPEKMFYFNREGNRWTFIGTDDWRNS
ncbi:MAG: hypothetical protein AB8B69_25980 [Chitinophagales bacterium]